MAEFDIFISYRRVGGFETAKHLYDLLRHDGYTVSFDIDTLREGKFNVALLSRIKMCQDFVLIVDPHTFDRTLDPSFDPEQDWLRQELSYALSFQKNVIPILLAGASFPEGLPDDIRDVKYMNGPGYSKDYFDAFYNKLKWLLHSKPKSTEAPILELSEDDNPSKNKAEIHIDTDTDCEVYRFKDKVTDALHGEDTILYLSRGEHLVTFVSKHFPDIKKQVSIDIPTVDYSDVIVVSLRSDELKNLDLHPLCIDGKFGFLDNNCDVQIPFIYEDAKPFSFGLAAVKQNGTYGYINKLGESIIPSGFDDASTFNESGIAPVKKNGKYGYIDMTGKSIIPYIYDSASCFNGGLAIVSQGGKYGYISRDGTIIIPCIYDTAFPFNDGIAIVRKGLLYGYIAIDGREVTPIKYYGAYGFNCGLARVRQEGRLGPWGFINKNGENVIPAIYQEASDFSGGLALVQKNYKYGYIDKSGNEVIPIVYDKSFSFNEGFAPVSKDKKYGVIDHGGHVIVPFIYDKVSRFYDGLASVTIGSKSGFINRYGKTVIPFVYDNANDFHEGLSVVELDGKYGYVDKDGQTVIPFIYDYASNFENGYAEVKRGKKYGFINKSGQIVIPIIYDYVWRFGYLVSSGFLVDSPLKDIAKVELDGKTFYIDRNGQRISSLTIGNQ